MSTTKETFDQLNTALQADPRKVSGLVAVYQFNLEGEDGGTYQIILKPDSAYAQEGAVETANCTLTIAAEDFKEMIAGTLSGTTAFMSGKLKIDGDLSLALRLETVLHAYSQR
ncbi:MAG: SCP2 sterol-binding domain-containing protein [Acidibacillus sp.]|uniref:SCP2 domain-containing protein n=1 Tax=Sulfoacidibacillus ferrooxidans TaxID=2005001 RepID=A0A9X1V8W3_9BACL|nr:SCP2 sterol-binding domain-containing protein [Sulfoacidibacillus ferrooxidans]MCI0183064.1 hypothetical protein [Sulfoacidibacillus ferrooxidans]MCY0893342.1 SCP2 sterol-binding domain-containing protein [Acidibacillus sp.]